MKQKIVKILSRPNLARPLVEPLVQQLLETKKVKDFTILRRILLLVISPIYCSFFVQKHLASLKTTCKISFDMIGTKK